MADLSRRARLLDERARDILEQALEVRLLLVLPAERSARLLTDDGENRLMVEP